MNEYLIGLTSPRFGKMEIVKDYTNTAKFAVMKGRLPIAKYANIKSAESCIKQFSAGAELKYGTLKDLATIGELPAAKYMKLARKIRKYMQEYDNPRFIELYYDEAGRNMNNLDTIIAKDIKRKEQGIIEYVIEKAADLLPVGTEDKPTLEEIEEWNILSSIHGGLRKLYND